VPVMTLAMKYVPTGRDPASPAFWFIMSMALLVGFITAYPMNWWLVSHHMKHGMMTVRSPDKPANGGAHKSMHGDHMPSEITGSVQQQSNPPMDGDAKQVSTSVLAWMTILSCVIFGLGLTMAIILGGI
jgi:hypothetical protein